MAAPVTILQLVGSPTDDTYRELSELYARAAQEALAGAEYRFVNAHVSPGGAWRFPEILDDSAIAAAPSLSLAEAVQHIALLEADLALPQMFCRTGVSHYRALLDLLDLPYLGNAPLQMALAADKAKTRAIVASAGVAVPEGQLLKDGEAAALDLPLIVKPNDADNSDGVALVRRPEDMPAAVEAAAGFGGAVLVERYIEAGREVRCGVIEQGGSLRALPLEEYRVEAESRPIRVRADKLQRGQNGALALGAKQPRESWIVERSDPVTAKVQTAAIACHRALGMRQYSLFDFRIDPTGTPWFLEAGPYCSFSPDSVIVKMMAADGVSLREFFSRSVSDLIKRPS